MVLSSIKPLIILLLFTYSWGNAEGINRDSSFNKQKIRLFYMEGEFDEVSQALEFFRKQSGLSREDSIFIFKHLGVVNSANPDTKHKGESYFFQLLKLMPKAKLHDMYVSDSIKAIFRYVKSEFESLWPIDKADKDTVNTASSAVADTLPTHADSTAEQGGNKAAVKTYEPPQAPQQAGQNKGSHTNKKKWIWWTAGGAAAAGAITVFLLASSTDESPVRRDTLTNTDQ